MRYRNAIGALALALTFALAAGGAHAFDESKYPNWKGQWIRLGGVTNAATWDPDKPWGLEQKPPLIAEYQKIFEENLAELTDLIGVDRVLFGSDYPHPEGLAHPSHYLDAISTLSDANQAKIMGGNMSRLLPV